MKISIVGAGFSGLTVAYYLSKFDFEIEIFEKSHRCGGLIHTQFHSHGLVETAANGLIKSTKAEELLNELEIPWLVTKKVSRNRFIFRDGPKKWALSPLETSEFIFTLSKSLLLYKKMRPLPQETLREWGHRCLGKSFSENMLIPALQGIYAGDPDKLSASLIFKKFGQFKGTIAPKKGMGDIIDHLVRYLKSKNVRFRSDGPSLQEPTIVATSASDASILLKAFPNLSQQLKTIEMLPMVSITAFFEENKNIKGFGCLYPRGKNIRALGSLFNNYIFDHRSDQRSETWMYGGADELRYDKNINSLSDQELKDLLLKDRKSAGLTGDLLEMQITRWPRAIPHYTVELEKLLRQGIMTPSHIFLHGNYLGGLGLSKILERSFELANKLKGLYG